MKQILFILSLSALIYSCGNDPKRDLVISFDDINDLEEGDYVVIKKQDVGTVTKIEFSNEYKMDVHIHLDKVNRLPRDSKFIIAKDGIFSNALYIVPGKSKYDLTSSDKPSGRAVKEIDWGKEFNDIMDESFKKPAQTQDSMLHELRDIKKEVQEVNEKTK